MELLTTFLCLLLQPILMFSDALVCLLFKASKKKWVGHQSWSMSCTPSGHMLQQTGLHKGTACLQKAIFGSSSGSLSICPWPGKCYQRYMAWQAMHKKSPEKQNCEHGAYPKALAVQSKQATLAALWVEPQHSSMSWLSTLWSPCWQALGSVAPFHNCYHPCLLCLSRLALEKEATLYVFVPLTSVPLRSTWFVCFKYFHAEYSGLRMGLPKCQRRGCQSQETSYD